VVARQWLSALLLGLLVSWPAGCAGRSEDSYSVRAESVATGFASPVALVSPEDGSGRLFVVDQVGMVWVLAGRGLLPEPFLDLREKLIPLRDFYDERGLLGLAFHPDFAANGRFFVNYSAPPREELVPGGWDHATLTSEFRVLPGLGSQADPGSERTLLAINKPGYNDEAGHIAFGPDGYLYVATGDSIADPATQAGQFAQDTFSLLGKILRLDVDGKPDAGLPYRIPSDNPFVAAGGRPEVYAYGFRNPYRFSFDERAAQDEPRLLVADVGQAVMEEVDLVVAGGNYGWPIREGTTCFNGEDWTRPLHDCQAEGLTGPVVSYAHRENLSAIIGGVVYRGKWLPQLEGGYVFGDWGRGEGRLFVAYPPSFGGHPWVVQEIQVEMDSSDTDLGQLLGIGQDDEGELYLLVKDPGVGPVGRSGRVYKLIPP
jgi:glucose/arabinose dehydrogenase